MRTGVHCRYSLFQVASLLIYLLACCLSSAAQTAQDKDLEAFCGVESSVEGLPVFGKIYKYHVKKSAKPEDKTIVLEPLVDTRVNGQNYVFSLGTGTNFTVFNERSFSKELFTEYRSDVVVLTPLKPERIAKVYTIDGSVGSFELNFDGNPVSALAPFVKDPFERDGNPHIDGLLGILFLSDKQLFSSVNSQSFALLTNAKPVSSRWRDAIACETAREKFQFVSIDIGEAQYRCKISSGAIRSGVVLELSSFQKLVDGGRIRGPSMRTEYSFLGQEQSWRGILDEFVIGGVQIKDIVVTSSPDGYGNSLSFAAFRDRDVLFDVENKKLYLSKEP